MVNRGCTSSRYEGSLQWTEDAGIISRCRNFELPELPLAGNAVDNEFKVSMKDTGHFTAMPEDGTRFDVLQDNLYGYKGESRRRCLRKKGA